MCRRMKISITPRFYYLLLAVLAWPLASRAQLVPVPLAARVQQATLIVEAEVGAATAERLPDGHLATRHALTVYKVFKGQLPAGPLSVLTLGGTLGLRREEVSNSLALSSGQQGVLLLEPAPTRPSSYQATAGPQGFITYDLAAGTAAEPFGSYPNLATALYPALGPQVARVVQPNARLAAAQVRRSAATGQHITTATPVISSFSPAAVTAGTSTTTASSSTGVLTINGTGFNDTQGTGYVLFRNADDGGATTTQARSDDYVLWTDTQIQVRVPSVSASGNTAGTGPVQVVNSDGNAASSASSLTVTYALGNANYNNQVYRVHLVGTGGADNPSGYVLHYTASTDPSFSVPPAARAAFETTLATWRCQAGANRVMGADASQTQPNGSDNINLVSFGALPTGVLGRTYSTSSGCINSTGGIDWVLVDTDYEFTSASSINWYFGTGTPGSGQYDFQSVALHELGHGLQLQHIISNTGVMNYALANGETRRTLDSNTDLAAASDETSYSTSAMADELCTATAYAPATGGCPLPVELVAFAARYVSGQGTALGWATASEQQAAYFGVESQDDPTAPWQEVTRLPAAGTSATTRQYRYLDARPLAGTRYYRLHQVDQDGTATYSASVAVQGEAAGELLAYPNPTSGLVHLRGPVANGATARVQLLDAVGRIVAHASGAAALDLPLAGLPAGIYVLEWDGGTGIRRQRLTVQ